MSYFNSYGELGSVIIHQTIYNLFPPSSFDPTLIIPLTPTEFIQRILVPEAAVGLIMEDLKLDPDDERQKAKAVKILRESAAYGVAMFPDADTNDGGGSGKSALIKEGKGERNEEDWSTGVGDEIVKERARLRRRELEEEERVEEEVWNQKERERASGGKTKGKKKEGVETKAKGKAKMKDKRSQDVFELSEASDIGTSRPRPRPRKILSKASDANAIDSCLAINASEERDRPTGENVTCSKLSRDTHQPADSNLCSNESAVSEDADWIVGRKASKRSKSKAKAREPSVESGDLAYPSSDVDRKSKESRQDSESWELGYPPTPTGMKSAALVPQSSLISLLSEDDEPTPRPKRTTTKISRSLSKAPASTASSLTSSNAKSSFPLQLARERRSES